ncbi:MAG: MBL fold metallo-hydrolase [Candidatus Brockarchaeota archaeon]|nr:MBL fold metallo-hydrolase [Candidatus Brockarchaeota archaeon]
MVRIEWLGHACFFIQHEQAKIVIDPFETSSGIHYPKIDKVANYVLVSHEHFDHNNVKVVKGNPKIIRSPIELSEDSFDMKISPEFHDKSMGKERGNITVFKISLDNLDIVHLGDLGEVPSTEFKNKIGYVDVLLVPVGGFYTINSDEADEVIKLLNPKVVIPMHYKTEYLDFPIDSIEKFLKNKTNVKRLETNWIEITKAELPDKQMIYVLAPPKK